MEAMGRHLLPAEEVTGDAMTDSMRVLSREYQMANSDEDRIIGQIDHLYGQPSTKEKELKDWATKNAKYRAAHDLVAGGTNRIRADDMARLAEACAKAKKIKPAMQGARLTQMMAALVRPEDRSLLLANVRPAGKPGLTLRPCAGRESYMRFISDTVLSPPDEPFILIEFGRSPLDAGLLAQNVSARRLVRVTRELPETINLQGLRNCIERARGLKFKELAGLARLTRQRIADLDDAERIDARIDKLGIPEVDDLMEVLPARDSLAWNILISVLTAEETDSNELEGAEANDV